ncbi:MAG: response regulator transcription factor [Lachnospiraceae bacterium]|nr:response regulator transcription factor [Lachnospiraceae bacterium]
MIKILIVDDERAICDLIDLNLSAAGYHCTSVQNGLEAIDLIEEEVFDLILLDIMLPGADGYDVIEYIRPLKIPVIFITAKHEVKDRVKGLKLGADDYLVKPFDVVELVARVEAVLRRYNKTDKLLTAGNIVVDVDARRVLKDGKQVVLTNKEFGLLVLFMQNKNVALFREALYEKVWGDEYIGDSRTLDLHVQRLRKKLGWEQNLVAVYKVGYRLEALSYTHLTIPTTRRG